MQKTNKVPDTGLALFTKASGTLSMGWRCRTLSQEGLRSPGSKVNSEGLCAPKKEPVRERERERKQDTGTKALMEQRCFNQHGVGIYTVLQSSYSSTKIKIKISDLQNIGDPYQRERVVNNHFYHMVHKKEEGTYHRIEKLTRKCLDSSAPGDACLSS